MSKKPQKIISFSGVKQSGKTTSVNFLHGYQLVRHEVIEDFGISPEGNLFIESTENEQRASGIVDMFRTDEEFVNYANANIWPFIKCYNFADPLKFLCVNLFGLDWEQCFGTDKQKNTTTKIKWEDMPDHLENCETGFMTARHFLQCFGTDICRKIKPDIWTEACIKRIREEQSEMSVIGDCRFPNEVKTIQESGGKVIRLTRQIFDDKHPSETSLDKENFDWKNFDLIIDNQDMTIEEQNQCLLENLHKWGW